jgi:hypothetical protein
LAAADLGTPLELCDGDRVVGLLCEELVGELLFGQADSLIYGDRKLGLPPPEFGFADNAYYVT